jgi:flavin reductase (DIM6/NTAB) family NADH-FMN oxidoreductase RutF/DNA-binding IclR family transcriptional regulator
MARRGPHLQASGAMRTQAAVDPKWFREVLSQYPTGVTVVTGIGPDGRPTGLVVGTFTSVSLDPPLVAFLPAKTSTSWPKIKPSGQFCINVLGSSQEPTCRVFASKEPDKFAGLEWRATESGLPILDGAVAWIDCAVDAVHEAGDHEIVVGRVRELDVQTEDLPLLFFQGGYGRFAPKSLAVGGAGLEAELRLADLARPHMEAIAAELDARCVAVALVGEELVVMASAGRASSRTPQVVGRRTPAVPTVGTLFMAYADDSRVRQWLSHADSDGERDEHRERLAEVRGRGYSVGLHSPAHAEYEGLLRNGLAADAKEILRALPYDPVGFTLDDAVDLRSLHAPVFDAEGRVALALNLYPGHVHDRRHAENCLEVLLAGTARATAAAGAVTTADSAVRLREEP